MIDIYRVILAFTLISCFVSCFYNRDTISLHANDKCNIKTVDSLIFSIEKHTINVQRFFFLNENKKNINKSFNVKILTNRVCFILNPPYGPYRRINPRFPLSLSDTLKVSHLFNWGRGSVLGNSYRVSRDTVIEINNIHRDCYHFVDNLNYHQKGILTMEKNDIFLDKEFLVPILIILKKKNTFTNEWIICEIKATQISKHKSLLKRFKLH